MDNVLEASTEYAALLAAVATLGEPRKNPHPESQAYVLLPQGNGEIKVEYLQRDDKPFRKSGTVKVNDTESFSTAVNRHAHARYTVIYAALHPAGFVAVLNDHHVDDNITTGPDWRDHRVSWVLQQSKECLAWHARAKNPMTQEEFAYFIEDNLPDFKDPAGARMLEIALNFKVNRAVSYKSALNLSDGTMALEYADKDAGGGVGPSKRLAMPETFRISIPVWDGLEQRKYQFDARLRYRVTEGTLSIKYELVRPHKVVEQAFADTLSDIRKGVKDVPIVFGTPE